MGQIDELIEGAVKTPVNNQELSNGNERTTLLSKLSSIIQVLGFIIIAIGVIFFFEYLQKTWHEENLFLSLGCLVGGISLLFYGLIGKCLDDIRKNTRK